MSWLAWLFAPRQRQLPETAVRPPAPTAPPAPQPEPAAAGEVPPLLCSLLGLGAPADGPLRADEAAALARVDAVLALPGLPDELLPRAAALVPQLLAMLRQGEHLPVSAMVQRVSRDVVLTAEVLRLASSAYYRDRGQALDLQQAIQLIGVQGLQTVIARVVLKPIYDSTPGPWSLAAGARLWTHAEALAAQAAAAAEEVPVFDAYLAGLLHDSGWTAALRVLDRSGAPVTSPSAAFCVALERRAHRLFGRAARRWAITPLFADFGADAERHGLAGSPHALASVLRRALPEAMAALQEESQPA
ncbi:HDOD domain-containing protein [Rubrivivax gelatinosus]|nr:HDOD domain-containing protein [Rubrivivax gelatinosus]MBK1614623.1 HDOD domain-containing protein [Rubrivivax gelatinosus]